MSLDPFVHRETKEAHTIESMELLRPGGDMVAEHMKDFFALKLFRIGLNSITSWGLVERFLMAKATSPSLPNVFLTFGNDLVVFRFPTEIFLELLVHMDIRTLTAMAATCKIFYARVQELIHGFFSQQFASWDLSSDSVRFLLDQTEGLLSGFAANQLIFPSRQFHPVPVEFLDFFIPAVALRAVMRYFMVATQFIRSSHYVPAASRKVKKVIILQHTNHLTFPVKIAVHVCEKEDPRATILRQNFTAQFVCISGRGVSVPYADLTFEGLSLLNHVYFPLKKADHITALREAWHPAKKAGITLRSFHFDSDGVCNSQLSCPAVIHNDANEFQFNYPFYYKPWGDVDPPTSVVGVAWSLGAHGCRPDTLCNTPWVSTFDRNVRNQTEDNLWVIRVACNLDVEM
ncbi:hypothetical protein DFH07DRAFT_963322 [Mycena maculata]|uniref:F-box domain-containing protein n=1 Tax=Mycena maculata TaxID=230809 RepID=A0AAD7IKX0_9AGAR|nr:hypothetical protein DFH07DRAFT_963322 [Mycena maculata]